MLSLFEVAKFFIQNMYLNAVIILCIELPHSHSHALTHTCHINICKYVYKQELQPNFSTPVYLYE